MTRGRGVTRRCGVTRARGRAAATVVSVGLGTAALALTAVPALALDLLPPVAVADTLTTTHDRTRVVPPPGVLANDLDLDGGTKAILVSGTSHGSVTLRADGGYTYVPAAGYVGPDQFRYRASSGLLDSLATTVSITVTNSRPIARPDAYSLPAGSQLTVGSPGVLANDSDADGDELTSTLVTGASRGSVSLAASGGFSYRPNDGYAGTDSFTYRAWDGAEWSDTATVSLTIVAPPTPAPTPAPSPAPTAAASAGPTAKPTPARSTRPSPTSRPSRTPIQTAKPSPSGFAGVVPGGGPTGPDGQGPSAPKIDVRRLDVRLTDTVLGDFGVLTGVEWAVPALVLVAPGLLLIIALVSQGVVGLLWIAFSRRRLRGTGVRREMRA